MANMSDYLENKLIDFLFRAQAYTPSTTLYIALSTATPNDASTGASMGEINSTCAYARVAVTNTTAAWFTTQGTTTVAASTGTTGQTSNVAAITYAAATQDWGTVVAVVITDTAAIGAGNALFWGTLAANKIVSNGDTFSFAVGSLAVQIDN